MDTLVATYSRPMFENEGYSQEDQLELYQPVPSLSLKFAMPPVAQVSTPLDTPRCSRALEKLTSLQSLLRGFVQQPMTTRTQTAP
jgi:hypothetical protein